MDIVTFPFAPVDLVAILRLPDPTQAALLRAICVEQLRAGHDMFTWNGLGGGVPATSFEIPAIPAPDAQATDTPPSSVSDGDEVPLTGDALRMWRQARFLSQAQLGQYLGWSAQTISALERGEKLMPPDMRALLQEVQETLP